MGARLRPGFDTPAHLLGGGLIAVGVARSLGRAGIPVSALGSREDPVQKSRYCHSFVEIGVGRAGQEGSLDWLLNRGEPGVVFPCSDDALELVAREHDALVDAGHTLPPGDADMISTFLDKTRTYALAADIGVPAPKAVPIAAGEDVHAACLEVGLPLLAKPVLSHRLTNRLGLSTKGFVARSESELRAILEEHGDDGIEFLASEIIPGGDDQLYAYLAYVDESGSPVAEFCKEKVRQYPPQFGMGCYHIAIHDDEVRDLGRAFFRKSGLRGLAYVEFKRDARDGQLKLIECNYRFGLSVSLPVKAGIDFPLIVYAEMLGRELDVPRTYAANVRLWHHREDLLAFRELRRRHELSARTWAASVAHRQHFPLFDLLDPVPSLWNYSRLMAKFAAGNKAFGQQSHP